MLSETCAILYDKPPLSTGHDCGRCLIYNCRLTIPAALQGYESKLEIHFMHSRGPKRMIGVSSSHIHLLDDDWATNGHVLRHLLVSLCVIFDPSLRQIVEFDLITQPLKTISKINSTETMGVSKAYALLYLYHFS